MELSGPLSTGQEFEGGLGWLVTNQLNVHPVAVHRKLRYLLLQTRRASDPIRESEIFCFARALDSPRGQITAVDLLCHPPAPSQVDRADMVLLGGSGDYSVTDQAVWLDLAFDVLRRIVELRKPLFASCWGFQALAQALGGQVAHDPRCAELGTIELCLTEAGEQDPVFKSLGPRFTAQAGHQDQVVALPAEAVLLASSRRVPAQAYRLDQRPIYCTQFHPELTRDDFLARLRAYPSYVRYAAGLSIEEFASQVSETPQVQPLIRRLVHEIFGQ